MRWPLLATERLANHDKKSVASGSIYQLMKVKGNTIELTFTNCRNGLITKDGKILKQFVIAGIDSKFVWTQAKIEGNKVIVWNNAISNPISVRYA